MKKTEEEFWSKFWQKVKLPETVDLRFKNDRVIAENFLKYIPKASFDKRVLEIGCAPGKWLVLFNKELNYLISGIEYVPIAADKTVENFKILNIPEEQYTMQKADFFTLQPNPIYDTVFSLGFIEHFDDWGAVLDKHLMYCKSNSYLVIGLPNFKGLNYYLQKFIDNHTTETKLLPVHNLNVMSLDVLGKYAKERNLEIKMLSYIGGFERSLFNTNVGNMVTKLTLKSLVRICAILFGKFNTKNTSSYIFGVFKVK